MILIQYVGTEAGLEWYWFVTSHIGHFCLELSKNDFFQLHYFFTLPDFMSFTTKKITCYDLKKSYHNFFDKI